jgi:gentisate 1,2-dioxygenase
VLRGHGVSRVGDVEHSWAERDIFTLPHWQWFNHRADGAMTVLLVVSDRGALSRLGLARIELG